MTDSPRAIKLQSSNNLHTWESAAQPVNRLAVNTPAKPENCFKQAPRGSEALKQSFNYKSPPKSSAGRILPQHSQWSKVSSLQRAAESYYILETQAEKCRHTEMAGNLLISWMSWLCLTTCVSGWGRNKKWKVPLRLFLYSTAENISSKFTVNH